MLIQTEEHLELALQALRQAKLVTADFETNYCNFQADRFILGLAFLCPVGEQEHFFYLPVGHKHDESIFKVSNCLPEWMDKVLSELAEKKTIWHNGKFDLTQINYWFEESPVTDSWFFYDTMLMSHMTNENKYSHSLYDLGKLVGEKKLGKELNEIAKNLGNGNIAEGWEMIPPDVMGFYAEEDIRITWKLFKLFFPELKKQELEELYKRACRVSHIIRKMEDRGVLVDRELCQELSRQTQLRLQELEQGFGFEPGKPAQLAHKLYALPPEGLGFQPEAYSKRKSKEFSRGLPIMDEKVLSRLNHPLVEQVLEWRGLSKAESTWFGGWQGKIAPDGRIHPTFKQHGTVTSRWSCENPNLQQLPRDVESSPVKKLLRATDGYELWEFDYSQVEFRLGSVYANCSTILNAYREGLDVHKITAQNVGAYNQFPENPDFARYVGKQTNFLTIYGGGPDVLKMQLWRDAKIDLSRAECKKILDAFHEAYPEFRRIMAKCKNVAEAQGYIQYWNGWRRHFFESYECSKAFNSLVQGGAGHIMMESMIMLDDLQYRIVCQVHDSVWIELEKDRVEEDVKKITEVMNWPSEKFGCPFPVDSKKLAA